jgi:hypothetical protein
MKWLVCCILELNFAAEEFEWGKNKCDGHSSRAVWGVGLGRLVAGIVGSNPA